MFSYDRPPPRGATELRLRPPCGPRTTLWKLIMLRINETIIAVKSELRIVHS